MVRGPRLAAPSRGRGHSLPGAAQGKGRQGHITRKETLFLQLSETAREPCSWVFYGVGCLPYSTQGARGRCISAWVGFAEVVPGSRPPCPGIPRARFKASLSSRLFPMYSVSLRKARRHCVLLNLCPLPVTCSLGGCLYWRFRPQGPPGSVQSPFSVLDRICALVCCVPVFVYKNEDRSPSQTSQFLFGTLKEKKKLNS